MTKNPHYSSESAVKPGATANNKPGSTPADSPRPPKKKNSKFGWWIALGLILVAGAAVATYFVLNPIQREVPNGVSAKDVSISEVQSGQCMRNFTNVNENVDIVDCSSPHNAQLIGTESAPKSEPFPGSDILQQRSQRVCDNSPLDPLVVQAHPDLKQTQGLPTEESWAAGDRRVDCIAFTEKDDALKESVLLGPDSPATTAPSDPGEVIAPSESGKSTPSEPATSQPTETGEGTPTSQPTDAE